MVVGRIDFEDPFFIYIIELWEVETTYKHLRVSLKIWFWSKIDQNKDWTVSMKVLLLIANCYVFRKHLTDLVEYMLLFSINIPYIHRWIYWNNLQINQEPHPLPPHWFLWFFADGQKTGSKLNFFKLSSRRKSNLDSIFQIL